MSVLESALFNDDQFASLMRSPAESAKAIQARLDMISPDICHKVGPAALTTQNWLVYTDTALGYLKNPEHGNVPDSLFTFMNYFPNGARILDIGCGTGRDAMFMGTRDAQMRKNFMKRLKAGKDQVTRFGIPKKSFHTIGLDRAGPMLSCATSIYGSFADDTGTSSLLWLEGDMHDLRTDRLQFFDGAWSSAALFMHTPREYIAQSLCSVRDVLRNKGILGVSYINNPEGLPYDNLRYSRTGEIKYFSRPTATEIIAEAERQGFSLILHELSDLEMGGTVTKDFFITQFFQKV